MPTNSREARCVILGTYASYIAPAVGFVDRHEALLETPIMTTESTSSPPPSPAAATDEAFETTSATLTHETVSKGCLHGSLSREGPEGLEGRKRAQALDHLLHALQISMAQGSPYSTIITNFIKEPLFAPYVDANLQSYSIAFATDRALSNHVVLAKFVVSVAKTWDVSLAVGKEEFCRVIEDVELNGQTDNVPDWYMSWKSETVDACPFGELCTDQEMILYLKERISCGCLDELGDETRKDQAKCEFCGKTAIFAKILLCAKCKDRRYCSKECQVSDWKEHKKGCGVVTT